VQILSTHARYIPLKNQTGTRDLLEKAAGNDSLPEPGTDERLQRRHPVVYHTGKNFSRDPVVTLSWLDRLLEKGERNSRCYDFIEQRPFWTMGWFRAGVVILGICVILFWIFGQPL